MNSYKSFKSFVKKLLMKFNIKISHTISIDDLDEFFAKIKPIRSNYPLVRLGGNADGGYLVPDDFNGVEVCFSPGVSNVANFELAMAQKGIKCYMADYSVDSPPFHNDLFDFKKKFLGVTNNEVYMTLDQWVLQVDCKDTEMILQADIEGGEYQVILDMDINLLLRFRILVIEFHYLDMLIDKAGFTIVNLTFHKLLKYFHIVHIHPNNCSEVIKYRHFEIPPVMEFTFIRKDRVSSSQPANDFPHSLDKKSVDNLEDITLPKCWYSEVEKPEY